MKAITIFLLFGFAHLHGQTKAMKQIALPEIKTIQCISIHTSLENIFSFKNCHDQVLKSVEFYNKKLADIGQYEVYLSTQTCETALKNSCVCDGANQIEVGFLVLIDKKSKDANVLIGSFNFLSDSEVYDMQFSIKGNLILLTESGFTDGDDGRAEQYLRETHRLTVLKTGQIRVETTNDK